MVSVGREFDSETLSIFLVIQGVFSMDDHGGIHADQVPELGIRGVWVRVPYLKV